MFLIDTSLNPNQSLIPSQKFNNLFISKIIKLLFRIFFTANVFISVSDKLSQNEINIWFWYFA